MVFATTVALSVMVTVMKAKRMETDELKLSLYKTGVKLGKRFLKVNDISYPEFTSKYKGYGTSRQGMLTGLYEYRTRKIYVNIPVTAKPVQKRARREQSVTGQGHSLAMTAASSGMSPAAELSHRISGLQGIKQLKELDDSLNDKSALKILAEKFSVIHKRILSASRKYLSIAEKESQQNIEKDIQAFWHGKVRQSVSDFNLPPVKKQVKQGWLTSTQVNFSAKAYPTVSVNHEDAAALSVLGGFLRNGFLHRVIREQGGAYGGGASHEPPCLVLDRICSYIHSRSSVNHNRD